MTKEKKKVISTAFRLLVILASIALASYAWLNRNRKLSTDEFKLRTNSYTDLTISLDEGQTWSTELALDLSPDFAFKDEITGDGINFYQASSKRDDGTPITFKKASNKSYLEFDVWFKSSGNAGVFLQNNSYVLPAIGTNESDLIGNNVERISSSGNFSRDLIASSVRLAFIENNKSNNQYILNTKPSLVWAPNKKYEINCNTGVCNVSLDSTNKQEYTYIDASETNLKHSNVTNLKDTLKASYEERNAHGDPMITYIDTKVDEGIKKVTIRIWIEGSDRDNVTALTGGMFVMNLSFTTISKQINREIPNVNVDENHLSNYSEVMEYSSDNGLTWITYTENSNPTFESGETVFVRNSESSFIFASDYKVLKF